MFFFDKKTELFQIIQATAALREIVQEVALAGLYLAAFYEKQHFMEWYIKKGISLNLSHFLQHAIGSGNWKKNTITEAEFRDLLSDKIEHGKENLMNIP